MLRSIIYTSSANTVIDKKCLREILDACLAWNITNNITGMLIYHEGTFLQVIEGEHKTIEQVFEKIKTDWRHKNVTILLDDLIEHREFDTWKMAFRHVNEQDLIDLESYIHLNDLDFGSAVKKGGAKSILKAFYEMNINGGSSQLRFNHS